MLAVGEVNLAKAWWVATACALLSAGHRCDPTQQISVSALPTQLPQAAPPTPRHLRLAGSRQCRPPS